MSEPVTNRATVHARVAIAIAWQAQRAERQPRRHLDRADFDVLPDAWLPVARGPGRGRRLLGVGRSVDRRGVRDPPPLDGAIRRSRSSPPCTRPCWPTGSRRGDEAQPAWTVQRRAFSPRPRAGSGARSRPSRGVVATSCGRAPVPSPTGTRAWRHSGRRYLLTGDKHFGSGFGISDYMFTTARGDGEDAPAFFMDVRAARSRRTHPRSLSPPSGTVPA